MTDELRTIIRQVAAGAGDGADALRRAGIELRLEGYSVEVVIDPEEPAPSGSVRVAFGVGRAEGGYPE